MGVAAASGCTGEPPLVLVYRGPAALPGCPESAAALVGRARPDVRVAYCGPDEARPLSAETLAGAAGYVQPGGGDLAPAWAVLRPAAAAIRHWVRRGGSYLGFCLGAYLAGTGPGFGLLPGQTDEYVGSPGAEVRTLDDTVVAVAWRGRRRHLYFQDGPLITLRPGAPATVLARYRSGAIAAAVAHHGHGRVAVVGPHPEADESWYADTGLRNPDGVRFDLGMDFVRAGLSGR